MKIPGILKVAAVGYIGYKVMTLRPIKKVIIGIAIAKGMKVLEKKLLKE